MTGAGGRLPRLALALAVALLALTAALLAGCGASADTSPPRGYGEFTATDGATAAADGARASDAAAHPDVPGVPEAAWRTLALIDAGEWPEAANAPGTQGGRSFGNNERRLPRTDDSGARIRYREWDVNAKNPHSGRDAERIVTGNDGSAWYTGDHYSTFTRMR